MVPVGQETLGRIMNVIGEPVDERGPINSKAKVASSLLRYRSWLLDSIACFLGFVKCMARLCGCLYRVEDGRRASQRKDGFRVRGGGGWDVHPFLATDAAVTVRVFRLVAVFSVKFAAVVWCLR